MLEERAAQWKDEYIRQGVILGEARGRAEGEIRGLVHAVQELLEVRFGALPVSVLSALAQVTAPETLRGLMRSAYQTASLADFIMQLKSADEKLL